MELKDLYDNKKYFKLVQELSKDRYAVKESTQEFFRWYKYHELKEPIKTIYSEAPTFDVMNYIIIQCIHKLERKDLFVFNTPEDFKRAISVTQRYNRMRILLNESTVVILNVDNNTVSLKDVIKSIDKNSEVVHGIKVRSIGLKHSKAVLPIDKFIITVINNMIAYVHMLIYKKKILNLVKNYKFNNVIDLEQFIKV